MDQTKAGRDPKLRDDQRQALKKNEEAPYRKPKLPTGNGAQLSEHPAESLPPADRSTLLIRTMPEACPLHRCAGIVARMTASAVAQYLAAIPADRRATLSAVRKAINDNLPDGYEEGIQFGMIGWYIPLSLYPAGYGGNRKVPLPFVGLASQKTGMVLHCPFLYMDPELSTWFQSEYQKSGQKLDMGKGCVRFKKLEDLPLDVLGRTVARVSAEKYMATYQAARAPGRSSGKKGASKSAGKKAKAKK